MMYPQRKSALRARFLWFLAAAGMSFALMASTSPQCARTGDVVLSPTLSTAGQGEAPGRCISDCAQTANDARRAEMERFTEAIRSCDPGTDCRALQAALHVSIMQNITEAERDCMSGCHNQGGGHGGN